MIRIAQDIQRYIPAPQATSSQPFCECWKCLGAYQDDAAHFLRHSPLSFIQPQMTIHLALLPQLIIFHLIRACSHSRSSLNSKILRSCNSFCMLLFYYDDNQIVLTANSISTLLQLNSTITFSSIWYFQTISLPFLIFKFHFELMITYFTFYFLH